MCQSIRTHACFNLEKKSEVPFTAHHLGDKSAPIQNAVLQDRAGRVRSSSRPGHVMSLPAHSSLPLPLSWRQCLPDIPTLHREQQHGRFPALNLRALKIVLPALRRI